MGAWSNRKYPNGCRSCGQTETKHVGLGLCQNCYRDKNIQAAARDGSIDFIERPVIEEEVITEELLEEELSSPEFGGERRPGTVGSPATDTEESVTPPITPPKKNWFGGRNTNKVTGPVFNTKERSPKGVGKRVTTASTLADIISGIGGVAMRTGHAPLGRYLTWQAPASGELLDQALAGSFIDKSLLQPAVKARGRLDVVTTVLGPPALIFMIERSPERAQVLLPVLKQSLRASLPTLIPAMKKAQEREKKVNDSLRELFDGADIPEGVDPVDILIEDMFGGYFGAVQYEAPVTEEAPENAA